MSATSSSPDAHARQEIPQQLGGELVLRAATRADAGNLLAFNTAMHGALAGTVLQYFLNGLHPGFQIEDALVVVDGAARIVSTLCLIPVRWRLGQSDLMLGQIEFVGTLAGYRGRGLVRAQLDIAHQWMRERSIACATIHGIPHYYRQYGYEYAVDASAVGALSAARRATLLQAPTSVTVRRIADSDVAVLVQLAEARYNSLDLRTATLPAAIAWFAQTWRRDINGAEGWIAEQDGRPVGSCWLVKDADALVLSGFTGSAAAACALLAHALALPGVGRIIVAEPRDSLVGQIVATLPSSALPGDAWYIRVNDPALAWAQLAREFERRIAASPFAGLNRVLKLSFYRSGLEVTFEQGRVCAITATPGMDEPSIYIPPDVLPKLLFGYRDVAQLVNIFPDLLPGEDLDLLHVLFPRLRSYARFLV